MTTAEARERFAAARVARLATADRDGRPHLVPVVFAVSGDRVYTVTDAKPKRTVRLRRLANVRENPAVALLVDYYDDTDWSALWWARADGRGRVLERDESEAAAAVELLTARYPQQRATGAVLVVDVERWSGWTATEALAPDERD
jgi:PPOX class probable F420-dependent enzyme